MVAFSMQFDHTFIFNSREKSAHSYTLRFVFKASTFRQCITPSTTCLLFGKGVEQGKTGHCKHFATCNSTSYREHQERARKSSFKGAVLRWVTPLISACLIPLADTSKLGHKTSIFLSVFFGASLPPTSPSSLQDGALIILKNSKTAPQL